MDHAQVLRQDAMKQHLYMLSMLRAGEIQRLTETGWWMREVRLGKSLKRHQGRQRNPNWSARPQRRA